MTVKRLGMYCNVTQTVVMLAGAVHVILLLSKKWITLISLFCCCVYYSNTLPCFNVSTVASHPYVGSPFSLLTTVQRGAMCVLGAQTRPWGKCSQGQLCWRTVPNTLYLGSFFFVFSKQLAYRHNKRKFAGESPHAAPRQAAISVLPLRNKTLYVQRDITTKCLNLISHEDIYVSQVT